MAIENRVEGLRADILLMRTSRAYAAYEGREVVLKEDVEKIAPFVLDHRKNQQPNNQQPPENPEQNQTPNPEQEGKQQENKESNFEQQVGILAPQNEFEKQKTSSSGKETPSKELTPGKEFRVDVKKSIGQYVATDKFELKTKRSEPLATQHYVFLIDSSGSMLKNQLVAYAKGAITKLVEKHKNRSVQFSVVYLFDGEAHVSVSFSSRISEVEEALQGIKTGGKTNMVAGLHQVKKLVGNQDIVHHLYLITDGKINKGGGVEETVLAYQTYCKGIKTVHVIDAEQGMVKLGLANELAKQLKATYEPLLV